MNLFNYKSGKKLSNWQNRILTTYFRLEFLWYSSWYWVGILVCIFLYFCPFIIIGLLIHLILK
jgi:hypothetical protein